MSQILSADEREKIATFLQVVLVAYYFVNKDLGLIGTDWKELEMHRKNPTNEGEMSLTLPKVYSIPEAARVLGIGVGSIYTLMRTGQLRKTKILGRTLVTVEEIDRFLAERVAASEAETKR